MKITNREDQTELPEVNFMPPILKLNAGGEAIEWCTFEDSARLSAKGAILWSIGNYEVLLHGGVNAMSGERSTLTFDTIIAVRDSTSPSKYSRSQPALTNKSLFVRDHYMCAYCGNKYSQAKLTRDHVSPRSKGGPDVWENVVTSCGACNRKKDNLTLEKAGMELLYVPYVPSFNEALILQKSGRILADQMDYLMAGVSKHSRVREFVKDVA